MSRPFRVWWAPAALRDVRALVEDAAARSTPERARRLYEDIRARIDSLTEHPHRGRVVPELREVGVPVYRELIASPHRIFFRVLGDEVSIIGVIDGRRALEDILLDRILRQPPG